MFPYDLFYLQLHTDLDVGNTNIRYVLAGEGAGTIFAINDLTGDIHAMKRLDREEKAEYTLTAQVINRDNNEPLEPPSEFIIKVQDINDNPPQFIEGPYQGSVPEMSPVGTSVTRVTATDADDPVYGNSAKLVYSILEGQPYFSIDQNSAIIKVALAGMDREMREDYLVVIQAKDMGGHMGGLSGTTTVTVTLTDINDNPPKFSKGSYEFTISEDLGIGKPSGRVKANDRDIGENARSTYSIIAGDEKDVFEIVTDLQTQEGILTLKKPNGQGLGTVSALDFESKNFYNLTVVATNIRPSASGAPFMDQTSIKIIVEDADEPPVFTKSTYVFEVHENAAINTVVGTVTARDQDATRSIVRYSIDRHTDLERQFNIHVDDGKITLAKPLDRETDTWHNITVTATEVRNHSQISRAIVAIRVLDINDNAPEFPTEYEAFLCENGKPGQVIQTISAVDRDNPAQGHTFHYRLEMPNNPNFTIKNNLEKEKNGKRSKKKCCELEEKERFWSELDEVMESIPTGERVVIGADFNGHVGEGNTGDEEVMGKFGVKERNLEAQMVVDFAKRMDMAVVNTYFQKREEHGVTYKSGAEVIRETGRKVLGVSSGRRKEDKETWWWNEEVQDSVQRKRLAKKKWDMNRTEENRQEYKELQRRVKREVSKAKQKAYDELYTRLDTREGEKDLYRLARQRDRDGKDVQQVRVIKDRDGRVLTSEESAQRRWKEYFEEQMNEENEREKRVEGVNSVEQKVDKIRKDEVRKALKRMKSGKAVGPDDIPVEVWKCLGEAAVEFLTSLFNRVLENLEKAYDRMPREELWYCMRKSGVAEKYVRVVQDMYERSRTVVRCAVGQTEEFKVEVGLHQGLALSPFLFAIVMDQLSEEVRQESPWTMMFADDIVICSESREQVEENLERWRFALERRGMKVSRIQSNGECGKEVKKRVQAETVSLRKRQESELEVAELKMLRFSLGVTRLDRIRNEYIRGTAHFGRLGDKVRETRLRWFGHVQRRENNSISILAKHDSFRRQKQEVYLLPIVVSDDGNPPMSSTNTLSIRVCGCSKDGVVQSCNVEAFVLPIGLSMGALIAILACIILLLVIVVLFVTLRRHKSEPLIIKDEEDVRENIITYDDEGGGEEDTEAFDIATLQNPDGINGFLPRKDIKPELSYSVRAGLRPAANGVDIDEFINVRLHEADNDPTAPPYDSIQIYGYEGRGSMAGSLSSLETSSSDSDQNFDYLREWGPRFRRLGELYSVGESDKET
ncbi:hypothetical protein QTP70_023172 [Hemibagrus guttatus]|uniref:ribonuclease H n=1 Tax=Hemibagrus guttatus TaxID=175788 RepID=A0AAE0UK41_9TELE|nr:hypothetical protein QTP70_023172 [Hemibagrus guttatus]